MKRLLAALAVLGPTAVATAHPIQFGVADVDELGGGEVQLSLRFSGSEASPTPELALVLDGCEPLGPVRVEEDPPGNRRTQRVRCAGSLDGHRLRVEGLAGRDEEVAVVVRRRDGEVERGLLRADASTFAIAERPDVVTTLGRYGALGVEHILLGFDHLLFVLALLLLVRSRRTLLLTLTAFTLGHSVTLVCAAMGWLQVRAVPVEATIALSIVVLARELEVLRTRPDRTGSLINPEFGSSWRLALVSTDMPLIVDGPKDYGIDAMCDRCTVCTRFCPAEALSPEKQEVNGVFRWHVDTGKCQPYFNRLWGCKICLMVCPFNGRGAFKEGYKGIAKDLAQAKDYLGYLPKLAENTPDASSNLVLSKYLNK